jgi:hypothetical protein
VWQLLEDSVRPNKIKKSPTSQDSDPRGLMEEENLAKRGQNECLCFRWLTALKMMQASLNLLE